MGTYKNIQKYIKDKYGYTPQTCWIAHAKELCGIKIENAHNRISNNYRVKPCPQDKLPQLKEVFIYFNMI